MKNGECFVSGCISGSKTALVSVKFNVDCSINKVFIDVRDYITSGLGPVYPESTYYRVLISKCKIVANSNIKL